MFWADEIVEDILKKLDKDLYLITDWTTPSGHSHIGSLRGVIIHDLARRGLIEKNHKAIFQYGFDDFDPMDGLPAYVDKSWLEHMGKPLCNVPPPDSKAKSYAVQYADEFEQAFHKLGIDPTIVRSSELYKEGRFNEVIEIVLNNAAEIRKIYKNISGSDKGGDWYPFQVVCPKCGKIGTTKVSGWDGEVVEFTCEENLVQWAKGCGYKGKISPFDGNGKLPWKVEWPAKWYMTETDIEGEGKDHFAAGGSRDIADEIYRKIFKKQPPFDIRYEHFLVGGAKMSSSKGLGVTAHDMADFLPANILRFLFIRTKYKRAIDFQPEGEAISLLYDEYDRAGMAFSEKEDSDLGRAFYFSEVDPKKERPKYLLRFSKIAYMLQMPRCNIFDYAEKEKARLLTPERSDGGQGAKLTDAERAEIENRVAIAKKWLEKFAPENYKFNIQKEIPKNAKDLTAEQKKFLKRIADIIKSKDWTGEELHKEIHNIKNEMKISPREAFSAIYLVFIGKDSGPQAGWLLTSLDKNFVIKRLEEVKL